jgi:pyruvate dehydrogenase E2 component (dihydrolipoamide acetyltransferase)
VQRASRIDLNLAVATPDGVVAPVIADVTSLGLAGIARERARVVDAARGGRIEGRDLAPGACTLSNLGAYPVDFFTPVLSGPQVALVATGRIAERVVPVDGLIGVRPRMWANVCLDHRAADGEAGGRLLAALERRIADLPTSV